MFDNVTVILASAVANAATFTVPYPTGRTAGSYGGGYDHRIATPGLGEYRATAGKCSFSFGASEITVTNSTGVTLAAGTTVFVQLDRAGANEQGASSGALANPDRMGAEQIVMIHLGAPITADPNGAVESQACTAADGLATGINGALASGGVATFDVPRNVVAAWTNTAVLTVTGTDEYGNVVVESSASGTSLAGKKAFKTVTGIAVSADVTGLTVGTGDVLGLPVFIGHLGDVLSEFQDAAKATAGTVVAGATAAPTATTGDVRGTYDPNAACDGSKVFRLRVSVGDPGYRGLPQFAG